MPAEPKFKPPTQRLQHMVAEWYVDHAHTYATVWENLDRIREQWPRMSRGTRIGVLKGSYVFTLYTQLTDTHLAEESWHRLLAGDTLRRSRTFNGAGKHNQLSTWIYCSLPHDEVWREADRLISDDKIDAAQKHLIDETDGVKAAKAGFVLANVGLVQKMCIDSNVAILLGADDGPDTVSVDTYEKSCSRIKDFFPRLSTHLEAYQLQWVLFDFQRFHKFGKGKQVSEDLEDKRVATHDVWFRAALRDRRELVSRMQDLTAKAQRVQLELAASEWDYDELTKLAHHEGKEAVAELVDRVEQGEPAIEEDADEENVEDLLKDIHEFKAPDDGFAEEVDDAITSEVEAAGD